MAQYLFVNSLPDDGLQLQHCRSHAAAVSHHWRRQKSEHKQSAANAGKASYKPDQNLNMVNYISDDVEIIERHNNFPHATPLLTANFVEGDCYDPFQCTAVQMTGEVREVLQYHLAFGIMRTYRAEALARSQAAHLHRSYPMIQEMLHYALTSGPILYAILAYTSARMAHNSRECVYRGRQTNVFMAHATHQVRMQLNQESSEFMAQDFLKAVFFMLAAEWYRQDYQALQNHMDVIKLFLRSSSPLLPTQKNAYLLQSCRFYDVFIATEAYDSPSLPLTWQPRQLTNAEVQKIYERLDHPSIRGAVPTLTCGLTAEDVFHDRQGLSSLARHLARVSDSPQSSCIQGMVLSQHAEGFHTCLAAGLFSSDFSLLISRHFIPWSAMNLLCSKDSNVDRTELDWMGATAVAILHQLLSLPRATESSSRQVWREEAVRLTLIMSLADTTSPVAWRSTSRYVMKIQKAILAMEGRGDCNFNEIYCPSKLEGQLMLWILISVLCAATMLAETEDVDIDLEGVESRAVRLALRLDVYTFEQMCRLRWMFAHHGATWHPYMTKLEDRIGAEKRCA